MVGVQAGRVQENKTPRLMYRSQANLQADTWSLKEGCHRSGNVMFTQSSLWAVKKTPGVHANELLLTKIAFMAPLLIWRCLLCGLRITQKKGLGVPRLGQGRAKRCLSALGSIS